MEKVFSSKRDAAFPSSPPTEFVMYDHSNPHVISHRHLTKGTGAQEAGLILQRSIRDLDMTEKASPGLQP